MGRYYFGDIEGKFWFAVQSSDDASFFGGTESEPNYINYYFGKDDLSDIKKGIAKCKKALKKAGLKENTDEWEARLELGEKILKCVEKEGSCEFEAEL